MAVRLMAVPLLDRLDAREGWMYEGIHQVSREVMLDIYGDTDNVQTAEEIRVDARYDPSSEFVYVVAVEGQDSSDNVVGFASGDMPTRSNLNLVRTHVQVRPDHRRRGIGTQLAEWMEQTSQQRGRTSWLTMVEFAEIRPGTRTITAAEGDQMPASSPGLDFALTRGYTLRQIERRSRLDLPVAPNLLDQLEQEAHSRTEGYRFHQWLGVPPEEWLPKIADLTTAMSTDPPLGGVSFNKDPWDGERYRQGFMRRDAKGHNTLTTIAEDILTGQCAGVTDIMAPRWERDFADQGNTIVRRDHRGHRLGLALKVLNLRFLAQLHPELNRILTENASENTHMLSINTALGFYRSGGIGWLQRGDR